MDFSVTIYQKASFIGSFERSAIFHHPVEDRPNINIAQTDIKKVLGTLHLITNLKRFRIPYYCEDLSDKRET